MKRGFRMSMSRVVTAAIVIMIGFDQQARIGLAQNNASANDDDDYYQSPENVHNFPEAAADAKTKGLHEIHMPGPIVSYVAMPDLDKALSVAALALVSVDRVKSFYGDSYRREIRSTVTLNVLEYLSGQEVISKRDPKAARSHTPGGGPSVQVTIGGGTLIENGVKIVQRSRYPKLEPGQKYIAFLSAREDDGVIRDGFPFGPNSLIGVDANGIVEQSPWINSDGLRDFLVNDESVPSFVTRLKKMWGGR